MNLVDLETFVRVAELGTMTAAAKALGIPKSTISRRITRLEDELGVALLQRGGRRSRLTDQGVLIHERCAPALREIADVETALGDLHAEPSGLLRLTTPHDIAMTPGFVRLIASYRRQNPKVRVEVDLSNRVVDLIEEGYDVALRPGGATTQGSGLMSRAVSRSTSGWYASPSYLSARGTPETLADLADHDLVLHAMMKRASYWTELLADTHVENPSIVVNDFTVIQTLTIAGAGIGIMPRFVATPEVEAGRLMPVLTELASAEGRLRLAWPQTRHMAPRVRAFIDLAVEILTDRLL